MSKKYVQTREQCLDYIKTRNVVCSGCGGKLEPIETVTNGGDPTYWVGCLSCCRFDYGVTHDIYNTAKNLVVEERFKVYDFDEPIESHIRGACELVLKVLRLHKNKLAAGPWQTGEPEKSGTYLTCSAHHAFAVPKTGEFSKNGHCWAVGSPKWYYPGHCGHTPPAYWAEINMPEGK